MVDRMKKAAPVAKPVAMSSGQVLAAIVRHIESKAVATNTPTYRMHLPKWSKNRFDGEANWASPWLQPDRL